MYIQRSVTETIKLYNILSLFRYLVCEEGLDVKVEHTLDDGQYGEGDGQHGDARETRHPSQVVLQ